MEEKINTDPTPQEIADSFESMFAMAAAFSGVYMTYQGLKEVHPLHRDHLQKARKILIHLQLVALGKGQTP